MCCWLQGGKENYCVDVHGNVLLKMIFASLLGFLWNIKAIIKKNMTDSCVWNVLYSHLIYNKYWTRLHTFNKAQECLHLVDCLKSTVASKPITFAAEGDYDCQCVENWFVSEGEGMCATPPRFLRWFMSNAPVFGHCSPVRGGKERGRKWSYRERRSRKKEKKAGKTRGGWEDQTSSWSAATIPFDRPQTSGTLLWNDKHVGHKSSSIAGLVAYMQHRTYHNRWRKLNAN